MAEKVVAITENKGRGWGLAIVFEALTKVTPPSATGPLKAAFEEWSVRVKKMEPKKGARQYYRPWRPETKACAWPGCLMQPVIEREGDPLVFCREHGEREAEQSEYFERLRWIKTTAKAIRENGTRPCPQCHGSGRVEKIPAVMVENAGRGSGT